MSQSDTDPNPLYRLVNIGNLPYVHHLALTDWDSVIARQVDFAAIVEPARGFPEMDGFVLHLAGVVTLRWRAAKRWPAAVSYRGGLTVSPRDVPLDFLWNHPVTNLLVYFPRAVVERTAETLRLGDPTKIAFVPRINFRDPLLARLGIALAQEMAVGGLGGRVYTQTLGDAFLTHALRTYATATPRTDLPDGKMLSPLHMARIRAYIVDNLAVDFGVHDLATYVGMSTPYFTRCFRRTTGFAPHQYVLRLRVEQARIFLCTTQLPISQIALLSGFADQSHLTHHIRRAYGRTPGAMRRAP